MLGNMDVMATLAVRDLEAARRFYEDKVGLELEEAGEEGAITYRSGGSRVLVYRSQHAGTNRATAATWLVGEDLEEVVEALRGRGIAFERYDMPDMARRGDVYVGGNVKVAWFKDPDGNIHALVSG